MQLNVLAPLWVGEIYKQLPCYSEIASHARILKTVDYLLSYDADVYVLCEVQIETLELLAEHFGSEYSVTFTSNKEGFWCEYLEGKQWVKNGTCVVTKNSSVHVIKRWSLDLRDGCMATTLEALVGSIPITIVSIHFDTGDRKYNERKVLLNYLRTVKGPCIVSGDFNMISTHKFANMGFYQSMGLEGHNTTVLLEGIIDHTLVRGVRYIRSTILDVPHSNYDLVSRACMNPSHSDHYATISVVGLM